MARKYSMNVNKSHVTLLIKSNPIEGVFDRITSSNKINKKVPFSYESINRISKFLNQSLALFFNHR